MWIKYPIYILPWNLIISRVLKNSFRCYTFPRVCLARYIFSIPRPQTGVSVFPRRAKTYSKRKGIYEIVSASWARSGPLSGREVWRRERDLPWPLREEPPVSPGSSPGFYSTPIDSRSSWCHGALSRRAAAAAADAEERSQLLCHALPSLPYLRCNLFPGINAPGEIFPGCLSRIFFPERETYRVRSYRRELSSESCSDDRRGPLLISFVFQKLFVLRGWIKLIRSALNIRVFLFSKFKKYVVDVKLHLK